MKNLIIAFAIALLATQIIRAQGTITYLSNLGQTSTGSLAVGSDLSLAAEFLTGNNVGGYALNSIQLGMIDALGTPSGFTVMIYAQNGNPAGESPGSSIGTLNGSLNPVTAGTYTYTAPSNLTLSPTTIYYIVLTGGTAVANGAYEWSLAGANSYNPSGGWGWFQPNNPFHSSNGSNWTGYLTTDPQFAITATAVPEPSTLGLLGLSGLLFLRHRRKAKAV